MRKKWPKIMVVRSPARKQQAQLLVVGEDAGSKLEKAKR
jgi:NAD-dependent DNA ligase